MKRVIDGSGAMFILHIKWQGQPTPTGTALLLAKELSVPMIMSSISIIVKH